jgi:hypothetical protein
MAETETLEPEDLTVVALTPSEMVPAQAQLTAWCDRKIIALRAELQDLEANLELATEHGWKHTTVASTLNRTAKRIQYYEKVKAALDAGFLIVPNLPVDIFAVRVQRSKQNERVSDTRWSSVAFNAHAQQLPAGAGRYVDDEVEILDHSYTTVVDGKEKFIRRYVSGDFDEVDFPITLVKPSVLEATARAMALKIFDQMGIVRNEGAKGDPIVVGRLIDPRGNGRATTFFVAWWLDTRAL